MAKQFKFGSRELLAPESAAAIEINPTCTRTIVVLDLDVATTLSIGEDATPTVGDEVIVKATSDGTGRNVTFGTGFTSPALAGVASKTKIASLIYDGSEFIPSSTPFQID